MSETISLVFPHQLFEQHPAFAEADGFWLIEDELFFKQLAFHQKKLAFHRASMSYYAEKLRSKNKAVRYFSHDQASLVEIFNQLAKQQTKQIHIVDPTDFLLEKRIRRLAMQHHIEIHWHSSPLFLNTPQINNELLGKQSKRFLMADFYKKQRLRLGILVDGNNQPIGGKWSFDEDNRQRFPKNQPVPELANGRTDDEEKYWSEAVSYVERYFPSAPGEFQGDFDYAISHDGAQRWLKDFVEHRLLYFGTYEDALVAKEPLLHHSLLSVYLNNGLLLPKDVLDAVLQAYERRGLPLNDIEGFVRQLLGWREFIRGLYLSVGRQQRTRNYWGYTRKIPQSFYDGTTGITPVDVVIKKVLKNGYCHHIERLMVLSNFMLLCDFDPDEVYRWFMELFLDAYDWVMVPNVYGMGQFADGGMMSTKPYISGSNYLMKMGDFEKGAWTEVWDGLYWRFIDKHRDFFLKNPRMGVMVKSYDKMDVGKRDRLSAVANQFLEGLSDE